MNGDEITLKRIYADRYEVYLDGTSTGLFVSSRTDDIWTLVDQTVLERSR